MDRRTIALAYSEDMPLFYFIDAGAESNPTIYKHLNIELRDLLDAYDEVEIYKRADIENLYERAQKLRYYRLEEEDTKKNLDFLCRTTVDLVIENPDGLRFVELISERFKKKLYSSLKTWFIFHLDFNYPFRSLVRKALIENNLVSVRIW